MQFHFGTTNLDLSARPILMGVLNVTPDSFSDGGKFNSLDSAVQRAEQMIAEGTDIIDIGGESTRPGAEEVSLDEELRRTIPVIEQIAKRFPALPISIDTYKSAVASQALDAGATIVNDISGGVFDPHMSPLCGSRNATMVLMHIQGTPRTMQKNPQYDNVVEDVKSFLDQRSTIARTAGVKQIMLDVGIGFGKTLDHNLALLKHLDEFHSLGYPLLLGVSRKSFIGTLLNGAPVEARGYGTAGAIAAAVIAGVQVFRVHDVKEMHDAATISFAMRK